MENIISAPLEASVVEAKLTLAKKRWPQFCGLPLVAPELRRRLGLAGAWSDRFIIAKYCGALNHACGGEAWGRPTKSVDVAESPASTSNGCALTPFFRTKVPEGMSMYTIVWDAPTGAN